VFSFARPRMFGGQASNLTACKSTAIARLFALISRSLLREDAVPD
jgi:hypothetical protein